MKNFLPLFLFVCLLTACDQEPSEHPERLMERLLKKSPSRLNCADSFWMLGELANSNRKAYSIPASCKFAEDEVGVKYEKLKIVTTRRCTTKKFDFEIKITVYKDDFQREYSGGYFCSRARFPNDEEHELGSVTDSPNFL